MEMIAGRWAEEMEAKFTRKNARDGGKRGFLVIPSVAAKDKIRVSISNPDVSIFKQLRYHNYTFPTFYSPLINSTIEQWFEQYRSTRFLLLFLKGNRYNRRRGAMDCGAA